MPKNDKREFLSSLDPVATGINLRELCAVHDISATALADRLGVSVQSVYGWFSGTKQPSLDHMIEISGILGVPIDAIVVRKPTGPYSVY